MTDKEFTHIDDFIDYGSSISAGFNDENELYARWMLDHFRRPATTKMAFDRFYNDKKLFATYSGERYRVTGASRMGDVWITKDFDQKDGYQNRVMVDELSEWSANP